MNKEKYIFAQLILFLNEDKFRRQDREYHIFEEFAYYFVNEAIEKSIADVFKHGIISILLIQLRLTYAFPCYGGWSFSRKKVYQCAYII